MPPESPRPRFAGLCLGEKLALWAWTVVIVTVFGRVLLQPHRHTLYPIFTNAAHGWLAGTGLYGRVAAGFDCYRYSPLVAALFVPLRVLPDAVGNLLWRGLSVAVYLGALACWARSVLPRPLKRSQVALLFLLVVPLSVGSLNNGQGNVLVLGLLLASLAAVKSERWWIGGGCLALACLFKLYPLAVGLLLALLYPRRFAGRWAVALGVGLALPFLLQQPGYVAGQYADWVAALRADDRTSWPVGQGYRDLRLLCQLGGFPLVPHAYLALELVAAAGMAALCLACRRAGADQRRLLTLVLALGCCWMTVFGPATESCTYMLLAPSLAWALVESRLRPSFPGVRGLLLASYLLFLLSAVAIWFPGGVRWGGLGQQPLAGLLFFIGVVVAELQRLVQAGRAAGASSVPLDDEEAEHVCEGPCFLASDGVDPGCVVDSRHPCPGPGGGEPDFPAGGYLYRRRRGGLRPARAERPVGPAPRGSAG